MREATCLGFDYGLRRIGIAVGDTLSRGARPLTTLHCANPGQVDWTAIAGIIEEWRPDLLVVGRPCHDDGQPGELAPRAERFSRQLHGRHGLPVHLVDEHLSSREAEARLAASGKGKQARDSAGAIDMMAAAVILETWLAAEGR